MTLIGCGRDNSLYEQSYEVNINYFTEDELMEVLEGTYSDYFVFYHHEEVSNWISSNPEWGNYQLVDAIENYNETYFENNILVVIYATWRAYSQDFFIKNQAFNDGLLKLDIQYYIPWYAFGDSWSTVYGFLVELENDSVNPIEVEISYVER
jgi:hypothetical protein